MTPTLTPAWLIRLLIGILFPGQRLLFSSLRRQRPLCFPLANQQGRWKALSRCALSHRSQPPRPGAKRAIYQGSAAREGQSSGQGRPQPPLLVAAPSRAGMKGSAPAVFWCRESFHSRQPLCCPSVGGKGSALLCLRRGACAAKTKVGWLLWAAVAAERMAWAPRGCCPAMVTGRGHWRH